MTTNEIHERLKARFGEDVGPLTEAKIDPFCVVKRERIVEVCRFLKSEPGLEFDFLEDETAVDWQRFLGALREPCCSCHALFSSMSLWCKHVLAGRRLVFTMYWRVPWASTRAGESRRPAPHR